MSAAVLSHALFDFADTLAELQPGRVDVLARYVEKTCGLRVPTDVIVRCYKAVDLTLHYSSVRTRTPRDRMNFYLEYNRHLLTLLGVAHLVSAEGLYAAFNESKKHWALKADTVQTLKSLREKGLRIGIISNFDSHLEAIVEKLGLAPLVDFIHISQSEGIEKPNPDFYLDFFKRHDIDPKKSIYLGDSYTLDFLPATQIGLNSLLLDEPGLYVHCPYSIRSIREIVAHVSDGRS